MPARDAARRPVRALAAAGLAHSRARFIAWTVFGMAEILGGDAAAGAAAIRDAVALAADAEQLPYELGLLPWLAFAPIFLREAGVGRFLLERSLALARAQAAIETIDGRPEPHRPRSGDQRPLGSG